MIRPLKSKPIPVPANGWRRKECAIHGDILHRTEHTPWFDGYSVKLTCPVCEVDARLSPPKPFTYPGLVYAN